MTKSTLRLRVFAGPNGSGKSTIINAIRSYRIKDNPVDFGIYINADDIASFLKKDFLSFNEYEIETNLQEFTSIALNSGLINDGFKEAQFYQSFEITGNKLLLLDQNANERIAQIVADFLRKKLLIERKKFSFETVFSHPSKLDIMKDAIDAGYKVYLYFVSTESPEVNKFRVQVRAKLGGHDVPVNKIEERYYRSLDLLFEAAQLTYQSFFFDNSKDIDAHAVFKPFAHFKNIHGEKNWDDLNENEVPDWFIKYYSDKVIEKRGS